MMGTVFKGHGSISGSHMGESRSTPLLGDDRTENRLKKPTTFICKMNSWSVKTQYISPLSMESTKQSLTEKQAKELRESRDLNILENLSSREGQIQSIENTFKTSKFKPVHADKPHMRPRRILPFIPYFERAPTADSEIYTKLSSGDRDKLEQHAMMKSFMASCLSADQPGRFFSYMVPSVEEVRADDPDDPTTYLITLAKTEAKYLPLPTRLVLRKKRAKDGKSGDEVEHFPVPERVTVRNRSTVVARRLKDDEDYIASQGRLSSGGNDVHPSVADDHDSGAEEYLSDD